MVHLALKICSMKWCLTLKGIHFWGSSGGTHLWGRLKVPGNGFSSVAWYVTQSRRITTLLSVAAIFQVPSFGYFVRYPFMGAVKAGLQRVAELGLVGKLDSDIHGFQ